MGVAKGYGAFHTGVEVYRKEWCFGKTLDGSTGIRAIRPGDCLEHDYRESIFMGFTRFNEKEVAAILQEMSIAWSGESYDILTRNCHHFSEALCEKLNVSSPPAWVNTL